MDLSLSPLFGALPMSRIRQKWFASLSLLTISALAGCASEDLSESEPEVDLLGARSLNLDNQALAIAVSDIATRPLEGFDPMLNETTGKSCIDASKITMKAGALTTASAITLDYVESQSQLAAQLGVNLTGEGFGTTSGTTASDANGVSNPAGLVYSFNKSSTSANFLLKAKATWQLSANSEGVLKPEYVTMAKENPDRFLLDCGAYYISKVMYEANVYALITFTSSTDESVASLSQQLTADMGLKFGTKTLGVGGTVNADLKKVNNKGNLKYSFKVATSGFLPTNSAPTSALNGGDPFDFQNKVFAKPDLGTQISGLSQLVNTMSDSLNMDITALATRVKPNQEPESNLVMETMLSQPAYVRLRRYSHVAPDVGNETWDAMNARILKAASAYEQGQDLYAEMLYRHNEEISRFLNDRGNGNLYAIPSQPKVRAESEVRKIPEAWKNAFTPASFGSLTDPSSVVGGTFTAPLAKALRLCAMSFDQAKYDACVNNSALISAIQKGRSALAKYKAQRVAHLRVFDMSSEDTSWDDAVKRCSSALGPEASLPVKDDVAQFGPLLPSLGGEVWYRSNSSCKRRVYSTANPDECDDGTFATGVLGYHQHGFACVPASGSLFPDYSAAAPAAPAGF